MIESLILGALITDNSLIAECDLIADDFTEETHRLLFTEIERLIIQRKPFDGPLITRAMEDRTRATGWMAIIGGMVGASTGPANFGHYCDQVKTDSTRRKAVMIGRVLSESGNPDEAITALMALQNTRGRYGTDIIDAVRIAVEGIEAIQAGGTAGVMTGLADLDDKLGGFHNTDLIVIAGRPSMGKTAVAMNLANNCGVPCGFMSAEQGREQIGQRIIALNGEVSVHKMRNGNLDQSDWKSASDVMARMMDRKFYINDKPGMSLADIQREARFWKYHHDIQIMFIDYLQKIRGTKQNTRDEVSEIVIGLKDLAKELNIPVVALAQINRAVEDRQNKRPYMADIAESGVIEREADQIITLYRDEVYNENAATGAMELILCKNRHGPLGTIMATWRAEFMQIKNYAQQWGQ